MSRVETGGNEDIWCLLFSIRASHIVVDSKPGIHSYRHMCLNVPRGARSSGHLKRTTQLSAHLTSHNS